MSEDKNEQESATDNGEKPVVSVNRPREKQGSSVPVVPILGMTAIVLLAIWVGLGMRPAAPEGEADEDQLRAMKAEVAAVEADLNAQRLALGLRPKENTYESIEEVAARMKKDADTMVALAATFQKAIAEKEELLSAKNSQIIQSEQTRQILVGELGKLRQQYDASVTAGAMSDGYKAENEALKVQRDSLNAEIARLRAELQASSAAMPADQVAQWERRLEEANRARAFLESRVEQLDSELAKARLFASTENELLPAAVELVRSLRKLENKAEAEIDAEYNRLGVDLGASALHMLSFATGSAELSAADQERIRTMVAEVPDGDLVLCIGYASETGNVDGNRELSSARATAAAELYTQVKRPGQLVQAVYLGQTDRFSNKVPERNQLVEIWRIRKK